MLIQLAAMLARSLNAPFNSLFEMHVVGDQHVSWRAAADLSILYLRCVDQGLALVKSYLESFNSLFEMLMVFDRAEQPPNLLLSILYLRCRDAVHRLAVENKMLSILYLRCRWFTAQRNATQTNATPFNSLFEMRRLKAR